MKYSAELSFQEDRVKELEQEKEKISEVLQEINALKQNIFDLQVIAKAFSNTGIPAIELESMAPEISDVTNEILTETYGDRFKVSFSTQREGSSGKKIEDFIINVFDSEKGRMKTLDLLCSGESIWIKQALFFAFSVLRSRRTGFCFRTRFMDESDGALDATGRVLYLKMIETAHKACNARLSVLITHSSELKEIIEQRIEL
jgi:DNA repair exonuclease SbcCD ATPase subunit